MERKDIREGSFQEEILELLKSNPDKGYTAKEIAEQFDRSIGSTSGTLAILIKHDYVGKNHEHPAKYTYKVNSDDNDVQSQAKQLDSSSGSVELKKLVEETRKQITRLGQEIEKRNREIEKLAEEIKELTKHREQQEKDVEIWKDQRNLLLAQLQYLENQI